MKKGTLILAASIVAVLVGFFVFSRFFVDLLWFSSLGFRAVFTTTWLTALGVFVVATGLSSRERLPPAGVDSQASELSVAVPKGCLRSLNFPWTSCHGD